MAAVMMWNDTVIVRLGDESTNMKKHVEPLDEQDCPQWQTSGCRAKQQEQLTWIHDSFHYAVMMWNDTAVRDESINVKKACGILG
jgi:RES domain-containing protein